MMSTVPKVPLKQTSSQQKAWWIKGSAAALFLLMFGLSGFLWYQHVKETTFVNVTTKATASRKDVETETSLTKTKKIPEEEAKVQRQPLRPTEVPVPKPQPILPPVVATTIQIKGDATCQSSTEEALKLLKDKAPTHYSTITKYVGVIECASQGSGMFAYENPPRFLVGDATRKAGVVWYAGTIVHDAGHSKLYHDYVRAHPDERAPNDIWKGEDAERICLEVQYDALTKIGGTQSQLEYVKNVIDSEYYNVPYDQRWW